MGVNPHFNVLLEALDVSVALMDLLDAIDDHVETRVLLKKRPNERRSGPVLLMHDITPEYDQARAALGLGSNTRQRRPA